MNSATIVQKLWNYCNVLRDDGMSYGDYVEQLTYLLFLKMADERSQPPWNQPSPIAQGFDWPSLLAQWARILARNLATAWLCSWHTRDSVTLSTAAISFRFMSCS